MSRPGRFAADMAPKAIPEENNMSLRVAVDTRAPPGLVVTPVFDRHIGGRI